MNQKDLLLENIKELHTTPLGEERIKKNLKLEAVDVVDYCRNLIVNNECYIEKLGKNWYCETKNIRITINSFSYTIITAHILK